MFTMGASVNSQRREIFWSGNPETGRSRAFAFIEMSTKEEGVAAIEKFNGQELGGRALKVDEPKERENRVGFSLRAPWRGVDESEGRYSDSAQQRPSLISGQ